MRVKVCGVTRRSEVAALAALPVDFVGLWHGVHGGRADLPLSACRELVRVAQASRVLEPVLVTFLADSHRLQDVILRSGVRWIQLHGYQTPSVVSAVKRTAPAGTFVVKALHVRGRDCLEESLIARYERAGVDAFLIDAATDDGRIGSTGRALDGDVVAEVAERITRPFLLAGGIDSESWREHATTARHPRCLGIDVDTNARGPDSMIDPEQLIVLRRAWKACARGGDHHGDQLPR